MAGQRWAFVLGGGGARGALQVGALRALLEHEIVPQLLAGTSAGALNAAAWARYGVDANGLDRLEQAWRDASETALLPARTWRAVTRSLFRRARLEQQARLRTFLIEHGLPPELRFADIQEVDVRLVTADILSHKMVVYGERAEDRVLEGLLASTALLPWLPLVEVDDRALMDGGIVSNVPVQVALDWGATHIVALDVYDDRIVTPDQRGTAALLLHVSDTVSRRHLELERALAEARGVPLTYVHLQAPRPVPMWDFGDTEALLAAGYRQMAALLDHLSLPSSGWHWRRGWRWVWTRFS